MAESGNIFFIDTDYVIRKVSRRLADKIGRQKSQSLIGQLCHSIFFDCKEPCNDCPVSRSIISKSVVEHNLIETTADGTSINRHVVVTPITDENEEVRQLIVDCLGEEVSIHLARPNDKKPNADELNRLHTDQFDEKQNDVRAVLVDDDLNIILYNHGVEELLPPNVQSVIGHNLFTFLPYYNQYPIKDRIESFVLRESRTHLSFRTRTDPYSERWVEHRAVKLMGQGSVEAVLIISQPVDEITFDNQNGDQSDKIRLLSKFASRVSHDIKNPLTTITTNIDFLKNDMTKVNTIEGMFKLLEYVDKIQGQVKQVLKILETVNALKVHNMDSVSEIDASQFLSRAITIAMLNKPYPNNDIKVTIAEDLPSIYVCELNLERAFSELLKSLLLNSGENGILNIYLNYIAENQGQFIFKIRANNAVQSFLNLEKMLDDFFTSKKLFDVSNLGLIIAYATILNHNGSMDLLSLDAGRTEVLIKLPRVPRLN